MSLHGLTVIRRLPLESSLYDTIRAHPEGITGPDASRELGRVHDRDAVLAIRRLKGYGLIIRKGLDDTGRVKWGPMR